MSLAIDRLERKGYARRERDPEDGRRVLLRVTPAGVRLREAKSVLDPVRVEQVLGHLSPADRETALKGLQMLARASEQAHASAKSRSLKSEASANGGRMKWILIVVAALAARGGGRRDRRRARCRATMSPAARSRSGARPRRFGPSIMQASSLVGRADRRGRERSAAPAGDARQGHGEDVRRHLDDHRSRRPVTGGTLTITEDGWVGNPIFRFVSRLRHGPSRHDGRDAEGRGEEARRGAALSGHEADSQNTDGIRSDSARDTIPGWT